MKTLIFSILFGLLASVASADTTSLSTYKESSAKYDGYIRDAKYGQNGNRYAVRYKLILDNAISASVVAKNCEDLHQASPTLRPGKYTVYPSGNRAKPAVVTCNPTDTATLIMMLNGED